MMELYYIWLQTTKGLPLTAKKEVLSLFSSPRNLFEADVADLPDRFRKYDRWLEMFKAKDLSSSETIVQRHERHGIKTLTFDNPLFLPKEKRNRNTPLLLYFRGRLPEWNCAYCAVVGSRRATSYGKAAAELVVREKMKQGMTIVSGLALGIDTVAHKTALELGGMTIAFLGNGLDVCYPKANEALFSSIESTGTLISPFPAGTPPVRYNFPIRNEIMATWADEIVVVEGRAKSGAVMTGRLGLANGKRVYAVPNNIFLATSEGSNALLSEGAASFLGEEEIAKSKRVDTQKRKPPNSIESLIAEDARSAEVIASILKRELEEVQTQLFALEMAGRAEFKADGKWHYTDWGK